MISLSKGVLKIKYNSLEKAKLFYELTFVLNMVVIFAFYSIKMVASVTALLMFFASCVLLFEKNEKRILLPYISIWYLVLIIYVVFSNMWATRFVGSSIFSQTLRYLIILLTTTSVSFYVDDQKDIHKLLDLFVLSSFIIAVLEFAATPFNELSDGSLGNHFSGCNPNDITVWIDFAVAIAFYKAYCEGKRSMYLVTLIFIMFCALSSSRKGFAASLAGPLMIVLLSFNKRGYVLRVVLAIALIIGAWELMMKNEYLYEAIGRRFDRMMDYVRGDRIDRSMQLREYFIDVAKSMFKDSPIIGNGIESFQLLMSEEYFIEAGYAHNNYWQLLSELGLVGLVLYYGMYIYIAVSLFKSFFIKKNGISLLFLTGLVMMAVLETGTVSFDSKFAQLIIAIIYCSTYALDSGGEMQQNRITQ